jgi:hypothetical protein
MKCQEIERWLSDSLDGDVSDKKRHLIQEHLKSCSRCQAFRDFIWKMNGIMRGYDTPEVSLTRMEEFSQRLRSRLNFSANKNKKREKVLPVWRWKWILATSFILVVLAAALFVFMFQPQRLQDEEPYVLSYEKAIQRIDLEIGNNVELEQAFNTLILVSIEEMLESSEWESLSSLTTFDEELFFWDDLSEEERKVIEYEIKKEMKS